MVTKTGRDYIQYGFEQARGVATTYKLDQDCNDLLVIDGLESLPFAGKKFQLGFTLFCFCRKGYTDFVMNGTKHRLCANELLVNCGDAIVTDIVSNDEFEAVALVISQDFMQESIMSMQNLWPYLIYVMEHPVLRLGESETHRIRLNYRLIIERLSESDHMFRREATIANLQACYLDVCDFLKRRAPRADNLQVRAYGIFDQFMHLVAHEYVEHRDVQWYAERMQLTPKYLSEVVKDVSGRTASTWISNFVITELKSLLHNSDLSIKEISNEMHFANPSFLGKYFKNVVGVSPMDYRLNR